MSDLADGFVMPQGPVTLYVTATEMHVDDSLRRVLAESRINVDEPYPRVLSISCDGAQLREMSVEWSRVLSSFDQERIICQLTPYGTEPSASDLMQSRTLKSLNEWIGGQWVDTLLNSQRLITYFQPIIDNRNPETAYAYECLLRGLGEDGKLIPPLRILAAARQAGLLSIVDQAARMTAIETAARMKVQGCIFINFNPKFLSYGSCCVDQTIEAALVSGIAPERFIFEVVESDQIVDLHELLSILDLFRTAGCRVALDDVGAGYNSLTLLAEVKPDFVKLDVDLIRGVDSDRYKSCVARKLLELAQELDVSTVAEGVETVAEWEWIRDHGANYAQGFLFARPAPHPPIPKLPQLCCDATTGSERRVGTGLPGSENGKPE